MPVSLYMDVHVPQAITDQLRRRGVNVLTAIEDGYDTVADDQLLNRADELGRVLFTQDIDFLALAATLQTANRPFPGILFGPQLGGTIGQFVADLELIATASEPTDWIGHVEFLPYRHT
jgi:hypothetical protein